MAKRVSPLQFVDQFILRGSPAVFSIALIISICWICSVWDFFVPQGHSERVVLQTEALSSYTQDQLKSFHQELWQAHQSTRALLKDLERESPDPGLYIKELKWKGSKISVVIGAQSNLDMGLIRQIWPHQEITLKKLEKKRKDYFAQVEFIFFRHDDTLAPDFRERNKEIFCQLAEDFDIVIDSWSYSDPPRMHRAACDRVGRVQFQSSMAQSDAFIGALAKRGWVLGRSGKCYASANNLAFDFEFLHLCRAPD